MPGIFFRISLCLDPGKVFLILDESQIEPRVLRWLAMMSIPDQVPQGLGVVRGVCACTSGLDRRAHSKRENPELYRLAI